MKSSTSPQKMRRLSDGKLVTVHEPVTVVKIKAQAFANQQYDIYCGRNAYGHVDVGFGNPFLIDVHGCRSECIARYKTLFYSQTKKGEKLRLLAHKLVKPGMRLGCWCGAGRCHADIIAEFINKKYGIT